ncbi:hypothetical protein CROQUDRAFT_712987 [Cronartium quercuum f. sp. fusiforme G11]|uniref:ferric-chelate reductase (NADPH) n=1 Tax=Cronartium quercuum f. sp. fusiforme G11 TaxID=708437 RepID=A0A9P6NXH2_9BASI|nr:hypothetical protein CROQUDRAFT_712987 [Cronartium quercuum f. sp. fusiforme G11]
MSNTSGIYGGSDDPCILGYTNGTYPNGTLGQGNWKRLGIYTPSPLEKAQCQAPNDPWAKSPRYAWWTNYYILVALAVIGLCNAIKRFDGLNRVVGIPSVICFNRRVSACARLVSYPQTGRFLGALPAAGPGFLLLGFLLFSNIICFSRRPYYRPPNYGTSVLGLRANWVAAGMIPWVVAFGARRNIVAYLCGVSHQRVMTIHKYSPWILLYWSIIHTWTNIIRVNRQEPWWYTWKHNALYRNGFPPLAALVWLCVMSLGPIRGRFYETFYIFHMIAAMIFVIWLYIHTENYLNSFAYIHATVILWGIAILWRVLAILINHGLIIKGFSRASLESLPGGAFSIRILVPPSYRWQPGSHLYLRFLTVRPWETHPFTITSVPRHSLYSFLNPSNPVRQHDESTKRSLNQSIGLERLKDGSEEKNELRFLIQPKTGLTKQLYQLSKRDGASNIRLACVLDGPYSGFVDSVRACDTLVMIAGGSGMAGLIPLILAVEGKMKVEVHWATRYPSAVDQWFEDGWSKNVNVQVYVTSVEKEDKEIKVEAYGQDEMYNHDHKQNEIREVCEAGRTRRFLNEVKKTAEFNESKRYGFHNGRPDVKLIVNNCVEHHQGRVGVIAYKVATKGYSQAC